MVELILILVIIIRYKLKAWVIIAVLVSATGLVLCLSSICFSRRRKLKRKGEDASGNDLLLFDFNTELHAINDGTNTKENLKKIGEKDVELPLFSYESVSAATNNFSAMNKLGEGGFGPVYKVRFIFVMNVL
ncbi:G-type lectin S-receptor-like serine/threonine-protein kinase RKS1 [Alnus glutinosa]|uniref:G-type lectin S-receptor-like serine/threonine-protein kinase RKS1 n=1 Tax=Alnus glutinosa TaxID=3517 RepID=UPI002D7899CB|nr:G-type lectin S-receptor-like serine/threonine-protein kinase RKS1 [Alnus glutinosa]